MHNIFIPHRPIRDMC